MEQIRSIVDRLEIPIEKKEALVRRITALNDEVDRDRTKLEVYSGLAIEVANTSGQVAKRLNPIRKWVDGIARLLGQAKEAEDARQPLQLEPPRKQLPPPSADVPEQD